MAINSSPTSHGLPQQPLRAVCRRHHPSDGTPNPKSYEAVKQLNSEIHALGTTLARLNAEEIYLNGETWGDLPIPEGFFAQGVDSTNFTVSYLKEKNGTQGYMMLVNNDYTNAATIRVKLDSAITSSSA